MRLLLDNTGDELIIWQTDDGQKFEYSSDMGVLLSLRRLIRTLRIQRSDISGIAVVVGRGKFTAARIAVTVVNALGFALGFPVVGVTDGADWLNQLSVQPIGQMISPQYSGPAHIGQPKK